MAEVNTSIIVHYGFLVIKALVLPPFKSMATLPFTPMSFGLIPNVLIQKLLKYMPNLKYITSANQVNKIIHMLKLKYLLKCFAVPGTECSVACRSTP